jgi:hypothetical protein
LCQAGIIKKAALRPPVKLSDFGLLIDGEGLTVKDFFDFGNAVSAFFADFVNALIQDIQTVVADSEDGLTVYDRQIQLGRNVVFALNSFNLLDGKLFIFQAVLENFHSGLNVFDRLLESQNR